MKMTFHIIFRGEEDVEIAFESRGMCMGAWDMDWWFADGREVEVTDEEDLAICKRIAAIEDDME